MAVGWLVVGERADSELNAPYGRRPVASPQTVEQLSSGTVEVRATLNRSKSVAEWLGSFSRGWDLEKTALL